MMMQKANKGHLDWECWPTVFEVSEAERIFMEYVQKRVEDVRTPLQDPGHMQPQTLIRCALAEVWRHGRKWQKNHVGNMGDF